MKKQSERTALTRAALIKAFWNLYKDKPITKITIKDVTDGAGFYRSTFYFYFSDIYSILEQIENDIIYEWEKVFSEVVVEENQEKLLEKIANFYEVNGEFLSILLSSKGDPMFQHKLKNVMREKFFTMIGKSETDIKMLMIFEFIASAMLGFFTEWYKHSKQIPAKEAILSLQSLIGKDIFFGIPRKH